MAGFISALLGPGSPEFERRLRDRAQGRDLLATREAQRARRQNAATARSTAATATDAGLSTAAAQRLGAQQEAATNAAMSGQMAAAAQRERQAAEEGLAQMDERQRAFQRQLIGGLMSTGGQLAGFFGGQGGEGAAQPGALPGGQPMAMSAPGQPAQGGSPLGGLVSAAAPIAGTAIGGPAGGMVGGAVGQALGGGQVPPSAAGGPGPVGPQVDAALGSLDAANPQAAPTPEQEDLFRRLLFGYGR